jgi:hypothetical protein
MVSQHAARYPSTGLAERLKLRAGGAIPVLKAQRSADVMA